MKKHLRVIAVILAVLLVAFVFAACNVIKNSDNNTDNGGSGTGTGTGSGTGSGSGSGTGSGTGTGTGSGGVTNGNLGTYYLARNGERDKSRFVSLDETTWMDNLMQKGPYEISSDGNIVLYFADNKEVYREGTIGNGIISFSNGDKYYRTDADIPQTIILPVWGPYQQSDVYEEYLKRFSEEHADELENVQLRFEGIDAAMAYDAMSMGPQRGAGVYAFNNDYITDLCSLGALAVVNGANLEWSEKNCIEAVVEATYISDGISYAYPLQADNGYFMFYNKAAFRGTSVWDVNKDNVDGTKGDLKDGYTFRDLYNALNEQTNTGGYSKPVNWNTGVVTWPMGDSWYCSGVFLGVGGDFFVGYDKNYRINAMDCWYGGMDLTGTASSYDEYDYTIGMNAVQCFKNSFIDKTSGKMDTHYLYSDGNAALLNDYITYYTDINDAQHWGQTPLAACVCGTWKALELQRAWGDEYACTVLPSLENDAGDKFAMKTFAGYKLMGVNPLCSFVADAPADQQLERLNLLHELAQYLCGAEISVARYEAYGVGPANKEALKNENIAADAALMALNAQYQRECVYPGGADKTYYEYKCSNVDGKLNVQLVTKHGGDPVGNGLGCRTQDSVPANYWLPIQNFGATMYQEFAARQFDHFSSEDNIKYYLDALQLTIQSIV